MTEPRIPVTETATISRCPKGHVVYAGVNSKSMAKHIAKDVLDLIKDGFPIETMSVEEVRTSKWCDCPKPVKWT